MCNRVVDWPILLTFLHFNLLHKACEHRFCTQPFDAMTVNVSNQFSYYIGSFHLSKLKRGFSTKSRTPIQVITIPQSYYSLKVALLHV